MTKTLALVGIIAVIVSGCSSGKESYQFGHEEEAQMARVMWKTARETPQLFPDIKTKRDACEVTVKTDASNGLPGLKGLDIDKVIEGCTDALRGK